MFIRRHYMLSTYSADLIKPKAFVCPRPGYGASDVLARELIGYCQEHTATYMRPRWVEFVAALPKAATGKIQRFKLRG